MAANRVGKNRGRWRLRGLAAPHRQLSGMVAWQAIHAPNARMGGRRHAADGARYPCRKTAWAEVCRAAAGMIPGRQIVRIVPQPGVPDGVELVEVKHAMRQDFSARIQESFDQGRVSFQGTEQDFVWLGRRAAALTSMRSA
jgi:hypothetical protein